MPKKRMALSPITVLMIITVMAALSCEYSENGSIFSHILSELEL